LTILVDGDDGLIHQIRVLMRPWPVVTLFRNAMYQKLSATIPDDYWELGPKQAPVGAHRKLTSIALKPVEIAPAMVLHSPWRRTPIAVASAGGRSLVGSGCDRQRCGNHQQPAGQRPPVAPRPGLPSLLIIAQ
jgi:hypothetical protein